MARRTGLISVFVFMLVIVGSALGAGMATFTSEQAAHQHCPTDTVVWLNTSSANYHFKGDRWYGHTLRGAYVCKAEADKNGEHPQKNGS